MIKVILPDGSSKEVEDSSSWLEFAAQIGKRLASDALVVEVNGELADLSAKVSDFGNNPSVKFYTFDSEVGKESFWHSTAHIMADAVTTLFPEAKYTIGPSIENGFYYDFDVPEPFTPDDLVKIEAEMARIVSENSEFVKQEISREEAIDLFKKQDNPYKVDLVERLPLDAEISLYKHGSFVDLCKGPHLPTTGKIKAIKLLSLAGAYWKGDEKNAMLQRIYGISFPDAKQLRIYLKMIEEAKKNDHRKIGKELDLFSFHEEGPGFPFWHAKGTRIYNKVMDYIRHENEQRDYDEVMTPILLNDSLWHKSGHWDNYQNNMYFTDIDEKSFAVKPMNCPGGLLIYKDGVHSYRELPIKNAEMGMVHRHEKSGVLHGLFRVRSFTQDDAHVFCTDDQLEEEISKIITYTIKVYNDFGFENVSVFLATKPEKAIGDDSVWEMATTSLEDALTNSALEYRIKEGEGAFYGPKIEFNVKDSLGRNWQCGTIQVDFSMPKRFELNYRGSDGNEHTPVMIHRAILGSLERFIGILIEHYGGKMPLWLAPVQMRVLSISEKVLDYATAVADKLKDENFFVERDFSADSLGNKIRLARNQRIPYIIIVGEEEKENGTLSYKTNTNENKKGLLLADFIDQSKKIIKNRELEL